MCNKIYVQLSFTTTQNIFSTNQINFKLLLIKNICNEIVDYFTILYCIGVLCPNCYIDHKYNMKLSK